MPINAPVSGCTLHNSAPNFNAAYCSAYEMHVGTDNGAVVTADALVTCLLRTDLIGSHNIASNYSRGMWFDEHVRLHLHVRCSQSPSCAPSRMPATQYLHARRSHADQ